MAPPSIPESLKTSLEGSKAEYVRLGKSGLRVSIPILGAMSIGHPDWAPWVLDEEKACPVLLFSRTSAILTKTIVPPPSQSCIRSWPEYLGHSKRLFRWILGEHNRKGNQEIQHPAQQARYSEQVLRSCWRGTRCQRSLLPSRNQKVEGLCEPRRLVIPFQMNSKF